MTSVPETAELEECLHPASLEWFLKVFGDVTAVQRQSWPEIAAGRNALLLAPTGSGKTLAAFLIAINRLMFHPLQTTADSLSDSPSKSDRGSTSRRKKPKNFVRVIYLSPLKALGVDVDRNLRSPLAGIRETAQHRGDAFYSPTVGVRSGDTPVSERARLQRDPPDILITTPESLYLLLTSKAREALQKVETVIVDEIHSMVANKRGAHLFVSLERLELLRRTAAGKESPPPLQRIGLSATQRPLEEVARLLGGATATHDEAEAPQPREVTIIEAGRRKPLELKIEVPVEDMKRLDATTDRAMMSGSASGPSIPSIWPSIHPRLVELIRGHRSTMIFVNSRRLAERLASAVNELADEEIALAHHGSIAKDARHSIEDRLKRGQLPAIVATSSLELGIDIGAVDLVIQIEAPPSIASGLQRIGRAGHQVGASSKGIVFPKYRGDLLACSAAAERMLAGEVEETFYLRNPLDVLAQQIVAMVALQPRTCDELYATVRQAAPFSGLSRGAFENVLDLLAGRYPSDEFAELRPRVNWDRTAGIVAPRKGAQRLAVLNAGAIPDRGLYGVFLADGSALDTSSAREATADPAPDTSRSRGGRRVGELDEEMVFEMRPGDVFLLGASSWRAVDITRDRVLVTPAPGEPGRMPFWRGEGPGRPLEFGRAIGELTRRLLRKGEDEAVEELASQHSLDPQAAKNLMAYLYEQRDATAAVPDDRTIVVECFVDEIGDWRVAILSPFGARVHAPWAMAILSRYDSESRGEIDMTWTDDGIMFRMPESDAPPSLEEMFPSSEDVEDMIVSQLGSTALFAARFRENAARALLLPRQTPGKRSPLWLQRRRSADLLKVASRYPSFPILLETYRECLRDVFDLRGLKTLLREVETRKTRVHRAESSSPSPFASAMMFNFMAGLIYDGDAPLAERRAASLALDHAQLRELLGDAELRALLDQEVVAELGVELQRLTGWLVKDADGLHDLLQFLGDLSQQEIEVRCKADPATTRIWLDELQRDRRVIALQVAGEPRFAAVEDAARFRDALGAVVPSGLPAAFLERVADPAVDLVSRFARTHTPFVPQQIAERLGLALPTVTEVLRALVKRGRVVEGEFLPGGDGREFCDAEVLKRLKRRSLAKLREQIEPVEPEAFGAFLAGWHCLDQPRRGLDGLLDAIEQLQGLPLSVADLETRILPNRILGYRPADLDELCAAGELVWQGAKPLSGGDGRVGLYLTDQAPMLLRKAEPLEAELATSIRERLADRGASFFSELERDLGGFRNDILDALWDLVWNGEVTNDTLAPMRAVRQQHQAKGKSHRRGRMRGFQSRRAKRLPGSEGRWSLMQSAPSDVTTTQRQTALAEQLLKRYGVVVRELISSEGHAGGFSGLYPVFRMMEDAGRVRRGYFAAGLGASQFALPGVEDRLRDRDRTEADEAMKGLVLAACDPANLFGNVIRWPEREGGEQRLSRSTGARVVVAEGELLAYVDRSGSHLATFLPSEEPSRTKAAECLAAALAAEALDPCVYVQYIDGQPAANWPLVESLNKHGFTPGTGGVLRRSV